MDSTGGAARALPAVTRSVRHHIALVLLSVVVAMSGAVGYALTVPRSYTASAVVLISPAPANPLTPATASGSGTQLTVAMETEAEIVATPAVAEAASADLGRLVPGAQEQLSVQVPTGTQMVKITYTSDSPVAAREGAQTFADVYLSYREDRAIRDQEASVEALRGQIEEADENLIRASQQAAEDGAGSYAAREVELYADRIAQLTSRVSESEAVATAPGRVINPAETPSSQNELPTSVLVAIGMLVGLAVGIGLAMVSEWRRDLVGGDAVSNIAGVPVFAQAPVGGGTGIVDVGRDPHAWEAYRRLRAGVIANGPRPHVLAVAAIDAHGHTSTVTCNLAVALAEARFSVLLVASDPDDRGVEMAFDVPQDHGLGDALVSDALRLPDLVVRRAGVTVLGGGAHAEDDRDLYAGPRFRRVIDAVRHEYDYILLSSAGVGSADGDGVISAADSALLVLTASHTTHGQVTAALERFAHLDIKTLGAVTVRPDVHVQTSRGSVLEPEGKTMGVRSSDAGVPA